MKKKLIIATSLLLIVNSSTVLSGCIDNSATTSDENTMIHAKLALLPGVDGSTLSTINTYSDVITLLETMINKIFKAGHGIKIALQNINQKSTKLKAGNNEIMVNLTADNSVELLTINIYNVKT